MTAGGDLRRPAPPPRAARKLAAAPETEGHERTGVTAYGALHDRTGGAARDAGVRFPVSGLGYERLTR